MREKRLFDLDRTPATPNEREAQALEYIAHYLDLIEGHLAKLADVEPSLGHIGGALVALARAAEKK